MRGPGRRTADGLTFESESKVYLDGLNKSTRSLGGQDLSPQPVLVSESNTPYTSTDTGAAGFAGSWESTTARADAAILWWPGSRGEGGMGMVSGAGGGKLERIRRHI